MDIKAQDIWISILQANENSVDLKWHKLHKKKLQELSLKLWESDKIYNVRKHSVVMFKASKE